MTYTATLAMTRVGRLYPSVILYGASPEARQRAAVELARTVFCSAAAARRPCGKCRHCTRVTWPEPEAERFHPDFHVLERDLRTSTSVDATKKFLAGAGSTPFEARGQVFVVAEADSLGAGAADALLKILEEPPGKTPRHFFLLAGSRFDLLPTLRSRSLSVYLGSAAQLDEEAVSATADELGRALDAWFTTRSPALLLAAAGVLARTSAGDDVRDRTPWATAAAAVLRYAGARELPAPARRALLDLAAEVHDAWLLRLRSITAERILEGLLARHLAGSGARRL